MIYIHDDQFQVGMPYDRLKVIFLSSSYDYHSHSNDYLSFIVQIKHIHLLITFYHKSTLMSNLSLFIMIDMIYNYIYWSHLLIFFIYRL